MGFLRAADGSGLATESPPWPCVQAKLSDVGGLLLATGGGGQKADPCGFAQIATCGSGTTEGALHLL